MKNTVLTCPATGKIFKKLRNINVVATTFRDNPLARVQTEKL